MLEYPGPNRWNLVCETVSAMELYLSLPYITSSYLGQFRLCNSARKSREFDRRPKLIIPRTHRCIIDCSGADCHLSGSDIMGQPPLGPLYGPTHIVVLDFLGLSG